MTVPSAVAITAGPCVVLYGRRPRARSIARAILPRRRGKLLVTRSADEFAGCFRRQMIDAAVVDLAGGDQDGWSAAALARDYPSVPFVASTPLRASEGTMLAQCVSLELAELLIEGVDEPEAAASIVMPLLFSTRFATALREPPDSLHLQTPLQRRTWGHLVAAAGRPVRTTALASLLGVTREHLSRTFATGGAPNLKRVIDLVRLIAAAELAKNPGYDIRDVAHILGFASSSHLSSTAQRLVGTKPASLARLRTVDLVDRFARGRGRSRS